MKIDLKEQSKFETTIIINVEEKDYKDKLTKAEKNVRKSLKVPGFRPGKAPMSFVKKKYGVSILVDTINEIVQEGLNNTLKEKKMNTLGYPIASIHEKTEFNPQKDANFTFAFDIGTSPEIKVNLSKKAKSTLYNIKLDKKTIDNEIEQIQARYGEMVDVKVAGEKDIIYGIANEMDGKKVLEGGVNDQSMSFVAELIDDKKIKEKIIGLKKDDEVLVDVFKLFNNNHTVIKNTLGVAKEAIPDLNKTFTIKVTEIKARKLAKLDKELYEKLFPGKEIKTKPAFEKELTLDLEKYYKNEANQFLNHNIEHILEDSHKVELPDEFLKRWLIDTKKDTYNESNIDEKYKDESKFLTKSLIEEAIKKEYKLEADNNQMYETALNYNFQLFKQYNMPVTEDQLDEFTQKEMEKPEFLQRMEELSIRQLVVEKTKELITIEEKDIKIDAFYKLLNEHKHH